MFEQNGERSDQIEPVADQISVRHEELAADMAEHRTAPATKTKGRRYFVVLAVIAFIAVSGLTSAGTTYLLNRGAQGQPTYTGLQNAVQTTTPLASATAFVTNSNDIISAVEKSADCVVEITTESRQVSAFAQQYVTKGAGSGVILTADGYIVTNYHVITGASNVTVRTTNGQEYRATLVGTDSKTDLAVLKIDAGGLPPVSFANSDEIKVGQLAIAIGNPLGELGGTVTSGIISAKDREISIDGKTMALLQTSAAVNPGNSGGGLFDGNGNLVGIVNAKSSGSDIEGLAFAIPSNTVQVVADEIIRNGYVTGRPQLGISVLDIGDARTAFMYNVGETGVYITTSTKDNGLVAGDKIISVAGTTIKSGSEISSILNQYHVGDTIQVVVKRSGQEKAVSVTLTEQKPEQVESQLKSA